MGVGPRPPADRTMSSQVPVCAGCGDVGCRTLGGSMLSPQVCTTPHPTHSSAGGPCGPQGRFHQAVLGHPPEPRAAGEQSDTPPGSKPASTKARGRSLGPHAGTTKRRPLPSPRPSNYRQNCPEQPFPTPDRGKQEREESDCCCLRRQVWA